MIIAFVATMLVATSVDAQTEGPARSLAQDNAASDASSGIHPMTTVHDGVGYMADPSPVHLAPGERVRRQVVSGTTKAILDCPFPLAPACFSWTPVRIDAAGLRTDIAAAGASITNFQNLNVFQDDAGGWHAVLAIGVRSAAQPDHWTVLVHARPTDPSTPDVVPLAWSADTVLSGSFSQRVEGNYDGKYYEEDGRLYLLYVRNTEPAPALRNGIVLQAMQSPTQAKPEDAVTLLTPGDRFGPLESEWYEHTQAKLVEAPYIARIAGKYALIYSTGAYRSVDYKAGVAWSDTLLPERGLRYRKVLATDERGVWGKAGRAEVLYLLQSQLADWPNFTGRQVISPGVASAVRDPRGAWFLYFAGFDPGDRPLPSPGVAEADHRRPYFVRLTVRVPPGASVAKASDAELASWLGAVLR